jgi:hypothetical protein
MAHGSTSAVDFITVFHNRATSRRSETSAKRCNILHTFGPQISRGSVAILSFFSDLLSLVETHQKIDIISPFMFFLKR